MPQTYYLGGRSPLVTWIACLLWALSALVAAAAGTLGAQAPAWVMAVVGLVGLALAGIGAGLWWRQAWARRAGVACLAGLSALVLAVAGSMAEDALLAVLVALPLCGLLGWLAGRLASPVEQPQFQA